MRAAKFKTHFVPCYSSCNKKAEGAQLMRRVERVLVRRCTPGASSQQPWGPQDLSDRGEGGFSSTDLLFRASRGTGAQTPCQARSSGQQQDQAAGSQAATQPCLPFAKASLRRAVLKPTFFLSSEPAQPHLGRLPPPHPAPSKLPHRKAAERHGRVFQGRGRRRAVPAPG